MEILVFGILLVLVFISYISFTIYNFGILPSLSESYYRFEKTYPFIFTWFCFSFGILTAIVGQTLLLFIAGSAITFVGASTAFKQKDIGRVHSIAAVVAILFSQLSIFFDYGLWQINILFLILVGLIGIFIKKNYIWWIEMLAFILSIIIIMFNLLSI